MGLELRGWCLTGISLTSAFLWEGRGCFFFSAGVIGVRSGDNSNEEYSFFFKLSNYVILEKLYSDIWTIYEVTGNLQKDSQAHL